MSRVSTYVSRSAHGGVQRRVEGAVGHLARLPCCRTPRTASPDSPGAGSFVAPLHMEVRVMQPLWWLVRLPLHGGRQKARVADVAAGSELRF